MCVCVCKGGEISFNPGVGCLFPLRTPGVKKIVSFCLRWELVQQPEEEQQRILEWKEKKKLMNRRKDVFSFFWVRRPCQRSTTLVSLILFSCLFNRSIDLPLPTTGTGTRRRLRFVSWTGAAAQ